MKNIQKVWEVEQVQK